MKNLIHGEDAFNIPFIRAELDDYILTANQFRVYAHLARRAGRHAAWPSVLSMSRTCRLREETVRQCVSHLRELNLIKTRLRKGHTTLYTLTPLSTWTPIPPEERARHSPLPETGWNFNPYSRRGQRGRKYGKERNLFHGENAFNILFIRAELDDYILTANQFRVYAHLARRAGSDGAWPSIKSMGRTCRLHGETVRRCLHGLRQLNLVKAQARRGATTLYVLTPYSEWKKPQSKGTPSVTRGALPDAGSTPPPDTEGGPPHPGEGKVSHEGTPFKENTVATPSEVPGSTHPALPATPSQPPNGSVTPSHHAALSQSSSSGGKHHPRPTQTSLQRKAYVIATRLQPLHWDNCKVSYSLHPSRAYAEQALREGHDEGAIIAAYSKALLYCHGVITDEILQGKRRAHEKATPALTVWLATQRLKQDDRPSDQRWDETNGKRQVRHQEKVQEDARIREEAACLAPEMTAWFAHQHDEASPTVPSRKAELQQS